LVSALDESYVDFLDALRAHGVDLLAGRTDPTSCARPTRGAGLGEAEDS
jgi:hypothetical protein